MYPKTAWQRITCARDSSEAIQIAIEIPRAVFCETAPPDSYLALPPQAQVNLQAVRRALGVRGHLLQGTGWELWAETDEDIVRGRKSGTKRSAGGNIGVFEEGGADKRFSASSLGKPGAKRRRTSKVKGQSLSSDEDSGDEESNGSPRVGKGPSRSPESAQRPSDAILGGRVERADPSGPSAVELEHAEQIKRWAVTSPHTKPPAEAVAAVASIGGAASVIEIFASTETLSSILAPVLRVFTENVGSSFATHLVEKMIIPYVQGVDAPIPRDIMQGVVSFSERHWRPILSLYDFFAKQEGVVSGSVGELLARVGAAITNEGAMQAFRLCCDSNWGENGIRVIEVLLGRCKSGADVADVLMQGLERNVVGLEKSVRFGKLLFSAAKELPGVAGKHNEAFASVCSRSRVFLAKRAMVIVSKENDKT